MDFAGAAMHALEKWAARIDRFNEVTGRAVAWLSLLLVLVTAAVAVLRYSFAVGWIWMQDAYLWAFAASFMLGSAYTLRHEKHVRVDTLYGSRGPRFRAWVDLLGTVFFLLPMLAVIFWFSLPYVADSWRSRESSLDAGGLPYVFLLKTVLLVFCIPLAAQGLALAARSALVLAGRPGAARAEAEGPR
jgi:TRAP-type mannitol/chloroaromatic compound transport system permease small subunit